MPDKRILVVDDDEGLQLYMKMLISKNYPEAAIDQAHDGGEALEKTLSYIPDRIFLDLNMPGMDGFEFLENWIREERDKHVRIIVTTSSFAQSDKDKINDYGLNIDFVTKPVSKEALEEIMEA